MTVIELRYTSRHRVLRVPGTTGSRPGRGVRGDRAISESMTGPAKTKVEDIRERIESGAYAVDAAKVADAIVARLQAGRSARDMRA